MCVEDIQEGLCVAGCRGHVAGGEITHSKGDLLLMISSEQMEELICTVSELSKLCDKLIKRYKSHQM